MGRGTARMLNRYGVVTVPAFKDEAARGKWEERVWAAMNEFPEYKKRAGDGKKVQRVLGGFGALANPSSFHHPVVQELRDKIKRHVSGPLLALYAQERGWPLSAVRYEMLFDRLCVRYKDFGAVTAEAWHRDIYDGAKYGLRELPATLPDERGDLKRRDLLLGGWLNLSPDPQRFVCKVGSHRGKRAEAAQNEGGGFAKEAAGAGDELARQAGEHIGVVHCDENGHIIVPPGHLVLFPQSILHAVFPGKQPKPSLRLFLGHRLTTEDVSLFQDLEQVVANNAVPRIPSGQLPPMFSANHFAFFSTHAKYREWGASTFVDACLFERTTPAGIAYKTPGSKGDLEPYFNKGNVRAMPSLAAMGFDPYPYRSLRTLLPEPLDTFR